MADMTDKITDVRNAQRPNSARVSTARSANGTNLACNDLSGWPTASKVHFVTYAIDTNSDPIGSTQLDCAGIVSGNTITNLEVLDGVDGGNSVGEVVEMLPTASWGQDLADALSVAHERTGALKAGAVASSGVLASGVVTAAKLANDAVETAKVLDDAITAPKVSGIAKDNLSTDSNPYKFHAYRSAALSVTSGDTIVFDTEQFDTNNNYDTTTGIYTVPVSGFYQFNGGIWTSAENTGTYSLTKNGSSIILFGFVNSSANNQLNVLSAPLVQLTAGDTIKVVSADITKTIGNGAASCYFGGYLVSRT